MESSALIRLRNTPRDIKCGKKMIPPFLGCFQSNILILSRNMNIKLSLDEFEFRPKIPPFSQLILIRFYLHVIS